MTTTGERAADVGRDTPAGAGTEAPDEAARARAYLDLWERHLSLLALRGPCPPRPAPRA